MYVVHCTTYIIMYVACTGTIVPVQAGGGAA